MQAILDRYVFTWRVARVVSIIRRHLVYAMLSRVDWLVLWFRIWLWCFLLIDSAPLLFVPPTLGAAHTWSTAIWLITWWAHVSIIPVRHAMIMWSVSTTLRPSSSGRSCRVRRWNMATIVEVLICRTVGYGGGCTWMRASRLSGRILRLLDYSNVWWWRWGHESRRFRSFPILGRRYRS